MEPRDKIAIGNTAEIFLVEGKIVKLYAREPHTSVALEAKNQAYAKSRGLLVPAVSEVTEINGRPALIMEHIDGQTMRDLAFKHPDRIRDLLSQSIEVQRRIHAIAAPDLRQMSERLAHQIQRAKYLSEDQKQRLQHRLGNLDDETTLCHGDFHIQNLIVNNNGIVIIDWMDATRGDIRLDACRSYVLYGMVSEDIANLYLDEYCRQSGLSHDEVLAWVPVIAAARLSEHVDETEEHRLVQIVRSQFP